MVQKMAALPNRLDWLRRQFTMLRRGSECLDLEEALKPAAQQSYEDACSRESLEYLAGFVCLIVVWLSLCLVEQNDIAALSATALLLTNAALLAGCRKALRSRGDSTRIVQGMLTAALPCSALLLLCAEPTFQRLLRQKLPSIMSFLTSSLQTPECQQRACHQSFRSDENTAILYAITSYLLLLVVPPRSAAPAGLSTCVLYLMSAFFMGVEVRASDVFWYLFITVSVGLSRQLMGRAQCQLQIALQSTHGTDERVKLDEAGQGDSDLTLQALEEGRHAISNTSALDSRKHDSSEDLSKLSAPPVMCHLNVLSQNCKGADCLPGDHVVQVEGQRVPQEIQSLQVGQHVLCMEPFSGEERFVAVQQVSVNDPGEAWIRVELVCGASLAMTYNHPVLVTKVVKGFAVQEVVEAHSIKPGLHSLVASGNVKVPVSKIAECTVEGTTSVKVIVEHGQRHSILVSPPAIRQEEMLYVALGSADLEVVDINIANTFIDMVREETQYPRRRCKSEPPNPLRGHVTFESAPSPRRQVSEKDLSSCVSGAYSSQGSSSSLSPAEVRVGTTLAISGSADSSNMVRLSDLLHLRSEGLASFGSIHHKDKSCKPCDFFLKAASGREPNRTACRLGHMCGHCHQHSGLGRRERMRLLKQRVEREAKESDKTQRRDVTGYSTSLGGPCIS
eukprot:TRINITY_DN66396_c0_g1_i1.p1 TRINITY_DN66396_c0_g1~~TRINITY_DN66396_c0_g1_i1.p1  ORF type:complete len:685 (+),score=130.25 TRINITY_DN66396_c0_g1_i1:29-2056(+)